MNPPNEKPFIPDFSVRSGANPAKLRRAKFWKVDVGMNLSLQPAYHPVLFFKVIRKTKDTIMLLNTNTQVKSELNKKAFDEEDFLIG